MISYDIDIINKLGMHARAAAKFVTLASQFSSDIKVSREGQSVDGKSIMGVLMLAASQGTRLNLSIEGSDQDAAMEALQNLISNRFGEDE
ncbi:MAG: HPr family phosphocarrier protein [Gammaproteobacteria bacterium]|nr:HPr family phosphocarrier protein [Gammaproteobacteria bacterium]